MCTFLGRKTVSVQDLIGANFSRARMGSADLSGVLAQTTDFSNADFGGNAIRRRLASGRDFSGANIGISNLGNSNLAGSKLSPGTIPLGTGRRVTLLELPSGLREDVFARLTQRQLRFEVRADAGTIRPLLPEGTVDFGIGRASDLAREAAY